MSIITDPEALANVVRLHAAFEAAGEGVSAAGRAVAEVNGRRQTLNNSMAEHDRTKPAPDPDATSELSARLAADPSAANSDDWMAQLKRSQTNHAAAVDAWSGKTAVLHEARERLTGEYGQRQRDLDEARGRQSAAWERFVNAARDAMVAEFERRFVDFYAEVLGPLDALSNAKHWGSDKPVTSGPRRTLTGDSALSIMWPVPSASGFAYSRLYPVTDRALTDAAMNGFRDELRRLAAEA